MHPNGPPSKPILDTAATGNFGHLNPNSKLVGNKTPDLNPITVGVANGEFVTSTHIAELLIPALPPSARLIRLFPHMREILLSIGLLCDHGCTAHFYKHCCLIRYHGKIILTGTRNKATNCLWTLDRPATTPDFLTALEPHTNQPEQKMFSATRAPSAPPAERVIYGHATLFPPALSTLKTALAKKFLPNIPGLTKASLKAHPPLTVATAKGHLNQTRKNKHSTKNKHNTSPLLQIPSDPDTYHLSDAFPQAEPTGDATNRCYATVWDTQAGKVYTDLTGKFPVPSSQGNNYIFLLYDYDSNSINVRAIPTRQANHILTAFEDIYNMLVRRGRKPHLHILDNECSKALTDFMDQEDIDYQKTPPGMHRVNAAERAIGTFKNHFMAGLCTTDKSFPLHLWHRLLPQAKLTLNMMRGAHLNPLFSAHEFLHGRFDFNATPLAPPGMHVVAHEKIDNRGTWSPHGKDAWYVGPALHHYRCYNVWIWDTKAPRITDTVAWFPPPHLKMPVASKADLLVAGINDLTKILTSDFHGTLEPLTDSDLNALAQTTFLLLQHADANPITSPDCAPVMRVPKGVPKGPTELPPVPLETYHNKSKPRSQQEPRLPSPILRRSPRHHPLSQQANAVLEPFTWPAPPPSRRPSPTLRPACR